MGARQLSARLVLLLRAVNVGGVKLAMSELRLLLQAEGFGSVETLLASGNAVVETTATSRDAETRVEAALARECGLKTEVLARDAGELAAVCAQNPFRSAEGDRPHLLHALFVRGEPAAGLDVLAPYCTAGEQVANGPGCLYLDYPAGSGTSKLTLAVVERKLGVRGTARNWNTVGKLLAKLC